MNVRLLRRVRGARRARGARGSRRAAIATIAAAALVASTAVGATVVPAQAATVATVSPAVSPAAASAAPAATIRPAAANFARIAGADRIATAIAISQDRFPTAGSAKAIVLARADAFPDALTGGPLAARAGGPVLLTASSGLNSAVAMEITRAAPRGATVYIIGGTAAISANVETQVRGLGDVPQRIAGADRYSTAVAIAAQLGAPTTIFEATGLNFPDALAGVPAAIVSGGALLLTNGSRQSGPTAAYLRDHSGGVRYALGGPAAAADPGAVAFIGIDRYQTAAEVADQFFPAASMVGVATGVNFPDSVAAGPALAARHAPLLLVPPSGKLPASVAIEMMADFGTLTSAQVYGGTASVSDAMAAQVGDFAGWTPTTTAATVSNQWTGRFGVLSARDAAGGERTVVVDGQTGDATTYVKGGATAKSSAAYATRSALASMVAAPGGFQQAVNAAYGGGFSSSGYSFPNADAEFAVTAQKVIDDPVASPTIRATVFVTLANLLNTELSIGAHDSLGRAAADVWAPIEGNSALAGATIHYLFDPATATPLEVKRLDKSGTVIDVETFSALSTTNTAPTNPYA